MKKALLVLAVMVVVGLIGCDYIPSVKIETKVIERPANVKEQFQKLKSLNGVRWVHVDYSKSDYSEKWRISISVEINKVNIYLSADDQGSLSDAVNDLIKKHRKIEEQCTK